MPAARPAPRWLLGALTAAVPLFLLGALEGGLRLAGVGRSLPLFQDAPKQPGYREANPEVGRRFHVDPGAPLLTRIDPVYFAAHKPERGLRIFVQGSSSAAGFPYGRFASLAGMLQQRLQDTLPERPVEVVQTAMAAVNSYAFLDFAGEILAEQPDAVVLYGGHNEYLGLLGVGSTVSAGRSVWLTRSYLALRPLRVFQLIQGGAAALRRLLAGSAGEPAVASGDATLMERVAGEREIPLGSELYQRGLDQLRSNLDALLARYQRAGVPVFVGTLACNERHQAPFTGHAPAGQPASESADAWFQRARERDAAGDFSGARRAYLEAKDRDLLRFRAPEAINQILRELSERHGAVLVDSQAALAAASPGGIIGRELMLEHLHPDERGYFLLAAAFYDALLASGVAGPGASARALPLEVAWQRRPLTALDRLAGEVRVGQLMQQWPFRKPGAGGGEGVAAPPAAAPEVAPSGARGSTPDRLADLARRMAEGQISWTEAMETSLGWYEDEGNAEEAARTALTLAATFPRAAAVRVRAARWLLALDRADEAGWQLDRAAELAPGDSAVAREIRDLRRR